jgi:predicted transcriptional regulator
MRKNKRKVAALPGSEQNGAEAGEASASASLTTSILNISQKAESAFVTHAKAIRHEKYLEKRQRVIDRTKIDVINTLTEYGQLSLYKLVKITRRQTSNVSAAVNMLEREDIVCVSREGARAIVSLCKKETGNHER